MQRFSREQLDHMSIPQLRMLDIKDKEEENLVQEIINSKLEHLPPETAIFKGDVPDIVTGAEEAHWQGVLDKRTADKKAAATIPLEEREVDESADDVKTLEDEGLNEEDSEDDEIKDEVSKPRGRKAKKTL